MLYCHVLLGGCSVLLDSHPSLPLPFPAACASLCTPAHSSLTRFHAARSGTSGVVATGLGTAVGGRHVGVHAALDRAEVLVAVGEWHAAIRTFREVLHTPEGRRVRSRLPPPPSPHTSVAQCALACTH